MIKKITVILFLIFYCSLIFTVSAENDVNAEYHSEVYESLEDAAGEDIWSKIEEFGLNEALSYDIYSDSFGKISEYFETCLFDKISNVKKSFFNILLILVISSTIKMFFYKDIINTFSLMSVAIVILFLTTNIYSTVNGMIATMKTASSFMLSFIPIYTVIISLSGSISSALSYNTLTVMFAQGISAFIDYFAVDIVGIYFSVSICLCFNNYLNLNGFINGVSKFINTTVGFIAGVFTALLSLRGVLAVSVDSASAKGIRFLISSLVPVIGSAISDAYSSVIGSISIIKGSVAVIGIVAMLIITLPSIFEGAIYCFMFSLLSHIADMFNDKECSYALKAVSVGLKFIVILSILQLFILVISTGLMLLLKGGG